MVVWAGHHSGRDRVLGWGWSATWGPRFGNFNADGLPERCMGCFRFRAGAGTPWLFRGAARLFSDLQNDNGSGGCWGDIAFVVSVILWTHGSDVEFYCDPLVGGEGLYGLVVDGDACGPVFPLDFAEQYPRAV